MNYVNVGPIECHGKARHYEFSSDPLLFLDNAFIESAERVERIWYCPEKIRHPIMTADKPWESFGRYHCVGGFSGQAIVPRETYLEMFYSIYHMADSKPEFRSFGYAKSKDGYCWIKQHKPIYKNERTKEGAKLPYYEIQNVMWDKHSQQYICMGHCKIDKNTQGTFYGRSDDPLKWTPKQFNYAYKNEDIHSLLGFDEAMGYYVAYPRVMVYKSGRPTRAIGSSYSQDLKKWTEPVLCYQANPYVSSQEIYNMPVSKRGPYYLGFPITYDCRKEGFGPLETQFSFSGNGVDWRNPLVSPFIPRGRPGSWDDCYVMTASPVEWRQETRFYYWGCDFPHDVGFGQQESHNGSVGVATLLRDRYCSLACPSGAGGTIVTGQLKGHGHLFVNCDASKGSIRVDAESKEPVDITGNHLDYDTGVKVPSSEFRIWITLKDAELFSIRIG